MEPVRIEFLMVDKLSGRLDQATGKMEQLTGQTSQARERMEELDRSGLSVQKTLGRLASAFALKELVGKITAVRGEFQQLEVAFETMLGSAEKADALLGQLTRTAATTPFGLEDVAQGAKQLLAYGFEAEKVNETLVRLGDIAAGLSVPLNDLVYLYGTTMAQGRLYTQDLNQFTGRGIPMISELAKQFGVAESKVKELVEAGKVGFPEVQKVIESLTDEGGKFGGLMEAQSKTISGQISNIEDALSMMFNELGQRSEGIINKTLSGVSYMVEHYEQFGRILLGLVGTYGVYRTAVMAVTAAKGFATAAEMVHYNRLLLVEKAQKALNATMLSNPYVLVATAVAGVAAAMMSMKSEAERLKDAEEGYEAQKQKVIEAEEEHRRKMDELCSIAGDEAVSTDTRREALNKLEQKYPDIFAMYDTEYEKLKNIKKIKEEIALQDGQKSITKTENELERVEKRIKALEGKTRTATEHYQDGYGKWTTRYVTKSARTKDEEAELKNLYAKRKQLSGQIRKDEVNAYFENLTGVSNETLEAQIKQRENLLAKMALNENKYGKISYGDAALTGTYSRDELQYQLNKLKSEQNLRNKPTDSSSEWVATAKKTYEDALKAYNDFIQDTENKLTQEDFEKQAKALKDAVDVAKKEYDKVKPGENKDAEKEKKAREKAETEAERAHKRQLEAERRRVKELDKLRRDNEQTSIDQMADGSAKRIRQIKLDYDKEVAEIQEQEAKWREAYAADRSQISDIIKDVETLNWLVKKGYAKPTSVSVWEAQSAALEKYMKDLDAEAAANDALWEKVQGSTGYYEWGNSLNGGSNEWSLRGYSKEQIELLYNQNKLSKEARDYYEAWVESGKSVEELNQHIVECMDSMREMVMGVSFDSFLSSSRDVLKQMRSDISALGEFTEETLSEAILNAFMYQELAKDLEPLYNDLSEHLINGTADKEYLENWRRTYEETMTAANARLDAISEATGVDMSDDKGTSQSAKAGGFQAMTQDQGSKLEGMFTSGLQHWSSMDEKMENVSEKMNAAENHLAKIEENTGKSAEQLEKIAENMVVILRDGLKVK